MLNSFEKINYNNILKSNSKNNVISEKFNINAFFNAKTINNPQFFLKLNFKNSLNYFEFLKTQDYLNLKNNINWHKNNLYNNYNNNSNFLEIWDDSDDLNKKLEF